MGYVLIYVAHLYRSGRSLAPASVQGNSGISAVARQMRRPFGPCGGAAQRHTSAAAEVDTISNDDEESAALVARREAKKKGEQKKWEDGGMRKNTDKAAGAVRP